MIHYLTDYLLERKIRKARDMFVATRAHADWKKFSQLILQRSPHQIAKMEKDKGIA